MKTKEYSNGEITILWQAKKCSHSAVCVKTLPKVYNPKERPWIKMENANSEALITQVSQCPSGALSIKKIFKMIKFQREENAGKGKFIIYYDNEFGGEMTYTWAGEKSFIIDHTIVEEAFKGKGFGKQLLAEAVIFAREKDIKIIPLCPFVKAMFDKDLSLQDVKY